MRQHFSAEIESRQGKLLRIVLNLTHHIYDELHSQQIQGKIQVFTNEKVYESKVTKQCLNKEIVWDSKYLKLIQDAFISGQDRHINMYDNKLSIVIQLNKGIRLTILNFELVQSESNSIIQSLISSFTTTSSYFQPQINASLSKLQQTRQNNSKIQSQLIRIRQTTKYEINRIKEQFIKLINPLKLKMKKEIRASRNEIILKKEQQTNVKIQNNMSIDEQIVKFCF